MIDTYQSEIAKKRKNARWFWIIVVLCATFLYFFFQGYYPDVKLGWKRIFSEDIETSTSGSFEDLIKSFGIINVKTIPNTASILIGSGTYGNNEKRMTNYGTYTMTIANPWYRENILSFVIDREKPYFIEEISLLPNPQYRELTDINNAYQIDDATYILGTASGMTASGVTSNTGIISKNTNLKHIGGIYFQSGATLYEWQSDRLVRSSPDRENYIETCPQIEWIEDNSISCPSVKSLYTESDIYMTGIVAIYRWLAQTQSGNIIDMSQGYTRSTWTYTGELTHLHTLDGAYYTSSGGTLTPMKSWTESIDTDLDDIILARIVSTEILFIGKKGWKIYLLIRHLKDPIDRMRTIVLPDHLDYSKAALLDSEGNLLIKTPSSLLFVYRGSSEAAWIVDGEILVFSPTRAIYRTDSAIWQADWSLPN